MPKGALLHAHLDATVNAAFLLKLALEHPVIHVRTPNAINGSTFASTLPEFCALPPDQFSDDISGLTDATYYPDSWVPLWKARETFDLSLGGPEGFDRWVIGAMMINPVEAYGTHNTVTKVLTFPYRMRLSQLIELNRSGRNLLARLEFLWQAEFHVQTGGSYNGFQGLIRFTPIFAEYIREFFRTSIDDGILYIEARLNFLFKYFFPCTLLFNSGPPFIPHMQKYDWRRWTGECSSPRMAAHL
jgi:adenosine deaminase CECR1